MKRRSSTENGTFREDVIVVSALVLAGFLVGVIVNWGLIGSAWAGDMTAKATATLPAGVSEVTLEQVHAFWTNREGLVVDARRTFFFEKERIPGAVSLPLAAFEQSVDEFQEQVGQDRLLIVYCSGYGCEDSHTLSERLADRGYQRIGVFYGGLPAWKDAGFPTEGSDVAQQPR